jgi:glutaredoxin
MKQQCYLASIYLSGAIVIAGLIFLALKGAYGVALLVLVVAPLAQWAYIRTFPAISPYLGYGRVEDQPAQAGGRAPTTVTLYTAVSCPFCPLVKQRLLALQAEMGFDLHEVDVTLKPDLLMSKGIRAVPVVEVGEQRVVGCATSEQLATVIRRSLVQT